jgi:HD-like signal output (HDOD) protein
VASGVLLATFAKRFRLSEDDAFLVGLLHDIGDFALLRIIYDQQKAHGRKISRSVFDALSTQWHEHIGLRLADAWNLPDPLPQLIGKHHGEAPDHEPERTYHLLIQMSDAACSMMRFAPYVSYDFFNIICVRELGLQNDAATRRVLRELPGRIDDRLAVF